MTTTLFVLGGCCLKPRKKTQMKTFLNMMVESFNVHFHCIVSDVLLLFGKQLPLILNYSLRTLKKVCIMTVTLKQRCEILLIGSLSVKIIFYFWHPNNLLQWMIVKYPLASTYSVLIVDSTSWELCSLKSCQ